LHESVQEVLLTVYLNDVVLGNMGNADGLGSHTDTIVAQGPRGLEETADSLVEAAETFGTPVYVVDTVALARAAAQLEAAFPSPWVKQYSLKANDLPAVVGCLAVRGWGANVVSPGEWEQARRACVPARLTSHEGIGKSDEYLSLVVADTANGSPPRWLSVESIEEIEVLARLAASAGLGTFGRASLDILLRVNPSVMPETLPGLAVGAKTSKFGMTEGEVRESLAALKNELGLRVRGIHLHVGSGLREVGAWVSAGVQAVQLLHQVRECAESADTVDFGGGFPVDADDGALPAPAAFRVGLQLGLDRAGLSLPPRPAVEPGRFPVARAGWLVSRVLHARMRPAQQPQIVIDAGMTELMRPALYGSRHPMWALNKADASLRPTAVEGPVCEVTDSFGLHELPALRRGDLVAIGEAGAYAASFTSRYNGRPQPPEVLLEADGSLVLAAREEIRRRDAWEVPTGDAASA
jgi:diaminopimelate decarboxylase